MLVDAALPHVNYQSVAAAIAWLERVFGFREYLPLQRWSERGTDVGRQSGNSAKAGRDGERSPRQLGYGTQSVTIFVDDVDSHYRRSKAAGAKILAEPHETKYGEYQYAAEDQDGQLFSRHAKPQPEEWGAVVRR